ncbi:VPLPA-CTERM sorting domain-containing protein [Poseidonocella sp. HB161398]|uniref:VPLPA-CTERM sorting domain-containing protein n=1 Tax=Poseidonocella sp. HB161398 TaxID=2320855 RepID=UPI0011091DEF|nr:VPLPA-CTERM sorting domain-containing protein [Poseidonocella sp. HB161398]
MTELGIADGGTYGTVLNVGQVASVDVSTDAGDTDAVLGFYYSPATASQRVDLSLNFAETELYGAITAYISADPFVDAADASASGTYFTVAGSGDLQYLDLSADLDTGLFYVILEWENAVQNSFSYDVSIQPAAVPLPGAALLLGGGLAGLGAVARRRRG